eukprot:CAMPEP_0113466668 /NCGR_PEP_ID=MMETSP0014_2-20120614/14397_1 /TAXON_ID=2857 /ORGANISM="Nitzschia sp." /LENGTH=405 /DNA_ID=CAMNT_0000358911 /DNA_START=217 /DNA_END=1434 /DNA_ORIENTATION=+ /assembly_acc=CAM_ASM_000159
MKIETKNIKPLLPHENRKTLYLTDSGLETTFIFKDNIELREFAAFELLMDPTGREHVKEYYRRHAALTATTVPTTTTTTGENENENGNENGNPTTYNNSNTRTGPHIGFVFESCTWRANSDWMNKLGYTDGHHMQEICKLAVSVMAEVRDEFPHLRNIRQDGEGGGGGGEGPGLGLGVLSGNIGPRSDAYATELLMTSQQAREYHRPQIEAMKDAGADLVTAATLNYVDEGIGIALAATRDVGIPCVLSFTVETDGKMVTGERIEDVITTIDHATDSGPAYYMINCAHSSHFLPALVASVATKTGTAKTTGNDDNDVCHRAGVSWLQRIGGVRCNASKLSHAELDNATDLDDGSPSEFGNDALNLSQVLRSTNTYGGCCDTDLRHIEQVKLCLEGRFGTSKSDQM